MQKDYIVRAEQPQIILIGAFATKNFSLERLLSLGIINSSIYDNAEQHILTIDELDIDFKWSTMSIDRDKSNYVLNLTLTDTNCVHEFKDLVKSIYGLSSTIKIIATGINFNYIITHNTFDPWNELGNKITPKEIWKESLPDKADAHVGMMSVAVKFEKYLENIFETDKAPAMHIDMRPTTRGFDGEALKYATGIVINHHYDLIDSESYSQNMYILEQVFDKHRENAKKIIENLLGNDHG